MADRRLRDYQRVSIYVGETSFDARVAQVHGDEAVLAMNQALSPAAGFLPAPAQLSFDHDGHLTMLTGMLYVEESMSVRFVVADGVRQSDKRRHVRLAVRLDAVVTPLNLLGQDSGDTIQTLTVDISAGGVLLGCGALAGSQRVAIELPGRAGIVSAVGTVVRGTPIESALCFTAVEANDQELLERFVLTVRRELARRFAAAAA